MPSPRVNWGRLALGLVLCVAIAFVRAESAKDAPLDELTLGPPLSLEEIEDQLQVGDVTITSGDSVTIPG
jgi:hypothetical protein